MVPDASAYPGAGLTLDLAQIQSVQMTAISTAENGKIKNAELLVDINDIREDFECLALRENFERCGCPCNTGIPDCGSGCPIVD